MLAKWNFQVEREREIKKPVGGDRRFGAPAVGLSGPLVNHYSKHDVGITFIVMFSTVFQRKPWEMKPSVTESHI